MDRKQMVITTNELKEILEDYGMRMNRSTIKYNRDKGNIKCIREGSNFTLWDTKDVAEYINKRLGDDFDIGFFHKVVEKATTKLP